MVNQSVEKICIVGGGTAGWMTAAALSHLLPSHVDVTLVESPEIANVGVGEATIPQIQLFNQMLGIDEDEFIRRTKATFKHGIEFVDWKTKGQSYFHPFGSIGLNFQGVEFHHYWLRMAQQGKAESLQAYAFNSVAAQRGKMMRSVNVPNSPLSNIAYAFHFDASLYVEFLQQLALKQKVTHILGTVKQVHCDEGNGFIRAIELTSNQRIEADLYIDCSGFNALLSAQTFGNEYVSWKSMLPCDRAVVAPSRSIGELRPYTRSTAKEAGWQWQIPLQHRMGNGYVYASDFITDQQAQLSFEQQVEGELLESPRVIKFKTGYRKSPWTKNCVAIGLSSGFIEPLESTAIHLIQSAIARLMSLFPSKSMDASLQQKYNQLTLAELEQIRDFIILHYHVTNRDDTEFWQYCRIMEIPQTLQQKIELFQREGRIFRDNEELFNQTSWLSVMVGQGLMPNAYHPLADGLSEQELINRMANIQKVINSSVQQMPTQAAFLQQILTPRQLKNVG